MNLLLHDATFKQIRDFIYDKSGIFIPDSKKYLVEKKLVARIQERNLGGFDDYFNFVRYNTNVDELGKLFDAITTNETYFFREPQQLDVFADTIAPGIVQPKAVKDLRLWSAACSTGEEPYTLSLLLTEKRICSRSELIASDISNEVLESAKKGAYGSYSMRNVPEGYLKKYFKSTGWAHELDPAIRTSVKFMNMNLVDEVRMRSIREMDVIFCRNVLIYFDDKAKQKVVSHLYDSLKQGGWLFIGTSESLHSVTRAFKPVIINKVVVYQKA